MKYGLATFNQYNIKTQNINAANALAATSSFVNITNNVTITSITLCGANTEGDVIFITGTSNAVIAGIAGVSSFTCSPGKTLCLFYMGASWYEAFRTASNGDTGNAGGNPVGNTGAQGAQGDPNNEQGPAGGPGAEGPAGAPGEPGATGAQGAQGA